MKGRGSPRILRPKTFNLNFYEILITCTTEIPTRRNGFLDLKTRTDFTLNLRHTQESRKRSEIIHVKMYS